MFKVMTSLTIATALTSLACGGALPSSPSVDTDATSIGAPSVSAPPISASGFPPTPLCSIAVSNIVKGFPGHDAAVATVTTLVSPGCIDIDDENPPATAGLVRWRVIYPKFPDPAEFANGVYMTLADAAANNSLPYGSLSRYFRVLQLSNLGPICAQARSADGSVRAYIALNGMAQEDCGPWFVTDKADR